MAAPVTWDMITAMAAQVTMQPKHRHNESLKHHRDLAETPAGVPNGIAINIRLADGVTMIRKVIHGHGQQFTFSANEHVPWCWPQMLTMLGDQKGRQVVGSGVVSLTLYERPGSYDHHRAYAGQSGGVKPPVWDWLVLNADGKGWLLHPRWGKNAKCDITTLEGAAALPGIVPAKGVGRSDGPGTYRRATDTYRDAPAPAEAGDPRPMQGIRPPPPPAPPQTPPQEVAPAEAGLGAVMPQVAEKPKLPKLSAMSAQEEPNYPNAAWMQPNDTNLHGEMNHEDVQERLDRRNAGWWAQRKFQERAWLEDKHQQERYLAAYWDERRAKEYAEVVADFKEWTKTLEEVAPAVAGQASAAAAAPAVAGQASAAAVEPATATAKATSSAAPAVARARPSVRQRPDWEGWSVVSDSDMDLEGDMDLED